MGEDAGEVSWFSRCKLRMANEVEYAKIKLIHRVIPLLLDDIQPKPRPVVIHGDLWSGNVGVNRDTGLPVIFDPSSCYAHNEFELGICSMFGGESCAYPAPGELRVGRSEKSMD